MLHFCQEIFLNEAESRPETVRTFPALSKQLHRSSAALLVVLAPVSMELPSLQQPMLCSTSCRPGDTVRICTIGMYNVCRFTARTCFVEYYYLYFCVVLFLYKMCKNMCSKTLLFVLCCVVLVISKMCCNTLLLLLCCVRYCRMICVR